MHNESRKSVAHNRQMTTETSAWYVSIYLIIYSSCWRGLTALSILCGWAVRRPLAPGWTKKQTPTPFLYHKLNLRLKVKLPNLGVYRHILCYMQMKRKNIIILLWVLWLCSLIYEKSVWIFSDCGRFDMSATSHRTKCGHDYWRFDRCQSCNFLTCLFPFEAKKQIGHLQ